jgi:hypothetical protein
MKLNTALDQISEIHKHISKTEIFRGYRPFTIFCIGLSSICFSFFQLIFLKNSSPVEFIMQWIYLSMLIFSLVIINIIINYFFKMSSLEKHQIRKILFQFIPSILAGALITITIIIKEQKVITLLPGVWAVIFGLTIISISPYLPELLYFVGFFYLISGGILFYLIKFNLSLYPLFMGFTFGLGHIISSWVLYLYLKQDNK